MYKTQWGQTTPWGRDLLSYVHKMEQIRYSITMWHLNNQSGITVKNPTIVQCDYNTINFSKTIKTEIVEVFFHFFWIEKCFI